MEDLPQIIDTVRLPVEIPIQNYLRDHHIEGKEVFPAVEAMQVLAKTVKRSQPDTDVTGMTRARFDKFLYLQPATNKINAFVDMEMHVNGDITARLLTKTRSEKSSITRIKEHAALQYPLKKISFAVPPLDLNSALEGVCLEVSPDKIYRELVPFGPNYHNIKEFLFISECGAIAEVGAPPDDNGSHGSGPLGSPFHLDAAFHSACVWGQRYAHTVAFPVGFENRTIFKATRPGEKYFSRIVPVLTDPKLLIVNIWIYDEKGNLRESIGRAHMRDVSAGRMKPPQWIIANKKQKPLEHIQPRCRAVSVIELKTLMPFAEKTLAAREKKRFQKMGPERKRSFLAARLACKRISRILSGNDRHTPPGDITTVSADLKHPCCPLTNSSAPLSCSVSHDDRFAIALAAEKRVGIDVEKASERVLKSQNLYMSASEQALVQTSPLGEIDTAVRIWSIKEAAAKALDISLADSWQRVQVVDTGRNESRVQMDQKEPISVFHDVVEKHVFSYVCLPQKTSDERNG